VAFSGFARQELTLQQLIDSTKSYWSRDLTISMYYADKALTMVDTNDCINYGECLKNKGVIYYFLYKTDTADMFYQKALSAFRKCENKRGIQVVLNNLGVLNLVSGDRDAAISYYDESYDIAWQMNDTVAILRAIANISNIYVDIKNYPKSLEVLINGIDLAEKCDNFSLVTAFYSNLYSSYRHVNDFDNWRKYINKAETMIRSSNDSTAHARLLVNIASGQFHFKTQWAKAKGLPIKERNSYIQLMDSIIKLNHKALRYFHSRQMNLEIVHIYKKLGEAYQFLQKYQTSSEYFEKGLAKSKELKMNNYIKDFYSLLFTNSIVLDDVEKNQEYESKTMEYEAILVEEQINSKIAGFEVKYKTLEKEREIEKQRLTIEKQDLEHKRQVYFRNFLLIGTLLLLIVLFLIYRSYLEKKKANQIILEKNALLVEANEEIRAQNEEIQSQRDTVVEQKFFIEKQKTRIEDSILYARRIQSAVLPSEEQLKGWLTRYFVIFKPKDVVSGDFFWVYKDNDKMFVAVADCTGHGVPGAFMSMLGITFLNEIVGKTENLETDQILNELRNNIIDALRQKSDSKSQRDSLEISLACIDMQNNECQWSGAGIPLWIVRKHAENKVVEEFIPDKMPVGIYHKIKDFTSISITLQSGDRLFMGSDGFADQFGGPSGKRIKTAELKQLILDSCGLNLKEQQQTIEEYLTNWMNHYPKEPYEQIDDITLLAFEV
jgi:serine phosphatase RsbU (regulator of sigma subunit)